MRESKMLAFIIGLLVVLLGVLFAIFAMELHDSWVRFNQCGRYLECPNDAR